MSSTNKTTNLELSQFVGSDKPTWLVDYNGDMAKIDAGVGSVQAQADATDLEVSSQGTAITNLQTTTGSQGDAITQLRIDVNGNTGSINTINSLIGNGEPTTTDKTLIGAINELHADIEGLAPGGEVAADDVSYDNQTSGLTATDVQAAIDELAQGGGRSVDADDVSYDNTASGLTATDVQAAIDELVPHWTSETVSVTLTKGTSDVDVKTFTSTPKEIKVFCSNGMMLHFDVDNTPADRCTDGVALSVTNSTYAANVYGDFVKATGKIRMTFVGGSSAPGSVTVDKIMYR